MQDAVELDFLSPSRKSFKTDLVSYNEKNEKYNNYIKYEMSCCLYLLFFLLAATHSSSPEVGNGLSWPKPRYILRSDNVELLMSDGPSLPRQSSWWF